LPVLIKPGEDLLDQLRSHGQGDDMQHSAHKGNVGAALACDLVLDQAAVRCAECDREVDEFIAIAEKWGYWSDGVGELVPFSPDCARREFASEARASGSPPQGEGRDLSTSPS